MQIKWSGNAANAAVFQQTEEGTISQFRSLQLKKGMKVMVRNSVINGFIESAVKAATENQERIRYLAMPGNPRYESDEIKPYFGYDQWAVWLAVVEMAWLYFLEQIEFISEISSSGVFERDFILLTINNWVNVRNDTSGMPLK